MNRPKDYPRKEWFAMSRSYRKRRAWELRDNLRLLAIFEKVAAVCASHGNQLLGMRFPGK